MTKRIIQAVINDVLQDALECSWCHQTLPVGAFYRSGRMRTGYDYYCKDCRTLHTGYAALRRIGLDPTQMDMPVQEPKVEEPEDPALVEQSQDDQDEYAELIRKARVLGGTNRMSEKEYLRYLDLMYRLEGTS